MSELVVDVIEMAKTTLRGCLDNRFQQDRTIYVNTLGAYMLKHWDEDEQRHITMQYTEVIASGSAVGIIGFIQNLGKPHLQTLFLPVKSANIHPMPEIGHEEDDTLLDSINGIPIPSLVIPVLDIQDIKIAA
ncbi:hypothetical protein H0X10_02545 [Candidatus Saccharibacteria bacterium]|nr:hypothetical protein [Candidatus Saccharibacteria bacterium]